MNNPKYVEINGNKYPINTDFRVAIECNRVAEDETINDIERALAIIYLLFGDKGIDDSEHYSDLLDLAKKYLSCGKEVEPKKDTKPDMDFIEDMDYIEASFMSDYKIDLENTEMHWWKFMKLMNGLSNSEMGNCCILNNVRNLRNMDVSTIKDEKTRTKTIEAKKQLELKKNQKKFTREQQTSIDKFNELAGIVERK